MLKLFVIFIYNNFEGITETFQGMYLDSAHAAYVTLYEQGFCPQLGLDLDAYQQAAFDQDHALAVHEVL